MENFCYLFKWFSAFLFALYSLPSVFCFLFSVSTSVFLFLSWPCFIFRFFAFDLETFTLACLFYFLMRADIEIPCLSGQQTPEFAVPQAIYSVYLTISHVKWHAKLFNFSMCMFVCLLALGFYVFYV